MAFCGRRLGTLTQQAGGVNERVFVGDTFELHASDRVLVVAHGMLSGGGDGSIGRSTGVDEAKEGSGAHRRGGPRDTELAWQARL